MFNLETELSGDDLLTSSEVVDKYQILTLDNIHPDDIEISIMQSEKGYDAVNVVPDLNKRLIHIHIKINGSTKETTYFLHKKTFAEIIVKNSLRSASK